MKIDWKKIEHVHVQIKWTFAKEVQRALGSDLINNIRR